MVGFDERSASMRSVDRDTLRTAHRGERRIGRSDRPVIVRVGDGADAVS